MRKYRGVADITCMWPDGHVEQEKFECIIKADDETEAVNQFICRVHDLCDENEFEAEVDNVRWEDLGPVPVHMFGTTAKETLTVRELKEKLSQFDDDAPVYILDTSTPLMEPHAITRFTIGLED